MEVGAYIVRQFVKEQADWESFWHSSKKIPRR
ncbi:MAG: hypothetical protein H6Q73_3548 [Firmicutes bacterium]|nr:hypothetical protein [Bacillota bacterium]